MTGTDLLQLGFSSIILSEEKGRFIGWHTAIQYLVLKGILRPGT